jgi:hypothetical protein
MSLKPETSLTVGLATAALVWAIYQSHMPALADVRAANPNNTAVESTRKVATWEAAGIVAAISLIAHDPTVFVIGGAMVVILDFSHRSANVTSPATNQVVTSAQPTVPAGS